jgi:hypothetical protein
MTLLRHIRHFGSSVGRALWLVASRQYLSLGSAGVLIGLAILVMTSDSFESRRSSSSPSSARNSAAAPLWEPRPPRPKVLFYVVNDATQRDEIAAAVESDHYAFASGTEPSDYVIYLIAGTKQEEAQTIARLNFEETAARQSGVDMRVIDLRGRFD